MALNFPGSPSDGDTYIAPNTSGVVYVYDASESLWRVQNSNGDSVVVVSETAPVSPTQGKMWWKSDTGSMFIYYMDGDSGQWVPATSTNVGAITPGIDADFSSVTANNVQMTSLNSGQLAGMRNVLINGAVSINQRGATYAGVAVGEYWADRWKKTAAGMTQIVEDGNYKPSTQYTLSGTGVTTQSGTSPASGDWDITTTFGDVIPDTATDIQLEEGSVATPFERRSYGLELMLCQRYYEANPYTSNLFSTYPGGTDVTVTYNYDWKVEKRIAPTVTYGNTSGFSQVVPTTHSLVFTRQSNAAPMAYIVRGPITAEAEL